jgi:putative aldouronate transport system permease protein
MYAVRYIYFIFLPVAAFYILFAYAPLFNPVTGGIFMAFKHFRLNRGFSEMEWVGMQWFELMWGRPDFWIAIKNTFIISIGRLIVQFPMPIILAIMLNEVRRSGTKRVFQTIFTFPYFLSWIIIISLMKDMFQISGLVNGIIRYFGGETYNVLASNSRAVNLAVVFLSDIWKGAGWGAIIYLASISGIDPTLYEAAKADGANRWHCVVHITWPSIRPTAVILLILSCGSIMSAGFDQIYNLQNAVNMDMLNILDTYIYRFGFNGKMNQSFSVAAGVFRSIANFALLILADRFAKLLGSEGLF